MGENGKVPFRVEVNRNITLNLTALVGPEVPVNGNDICVSLLKDKLSNLISENMKCEMELSGNRRLKGIVKRVSGQGDTIDLNLGLSGV